MRLVTMNVWNANGAMLLRGVIAGALGLLLCGIGPATAEKDDSYYVIGTGNPNVDETMYWKDAENVLQDLSQFSSLYVRYHHW
jgi:hypothetical protein